MLHHITLLIQYLVDKNGSAEYGSVFATVANFAIRLRHSANAAFDLRKRPLIGAARYQEIEALRQHPHPVGTRSKEKCVIGKNDWIIGRRCVRKKGAGGPHRHASRFSGHDERTTVLPKHIYVSLGSFLSCGFDYFFVTYRALSRPVAACDEERLSRFVTLNALLSATTYNAEHAIWFNPARRKMYLPKRTLYGHRHVGRAEAGGETTLDQE